MAQNAFPVDRYIRLETVASRTISENAGPGSFFLSFLWDDFREPRRFEDKEFYNFKVRREQTLNSWIKSKFLDSLESSESPISIAHEDRDFLRFYVRSEPVQHGTRLFELLEPDTDVLFLAVRLEKPESSQIDMEELMDASLSPTRTEPDESTYPDTDNHSDAQADSQDSYHTSFQDAQPRDTSAYFGDVEFGSKGTSQPSQPPESSPPRNSRTRHLLSPQVLLTPPKHKHRRPPVSPSPLAVQVPESANRPMVKPKPPPLDYNSIPPSKLFNETKAKSFTGCSDRPGSLPARPSTWQPRRPIMGASFDSSTTRTTRASSSWSASTRPTGISKSVMSSKRRLRAESTQQGANSGRVFGTLAEEALRGVNESHKTQHHATPFPKKVPAPRLSRSMEYPPKEVPMSSDEVPSPPPEPSKRHAVVESRKSKPVTTPEAAKVRLPTPDLVEKFQHGLEEAIRVTEKKEALQQQLLTEQEMIRQKEEELERIRLEELNDDATETELDEPMEDSQFPEVEPLPEHDETIEESQFPDNSNTQYDFSQIDLTQRSSLQQAISTASIDQISNLRTFASHRIRKLLRTLEQNRRIASTKAEVDKFIKEGQRLLQNPRSAKVVIGVVGDSGHGKSSMINALLEEDQIVTTSGMYACTAAVTEIRYNPKTKEEPQPYRAEIEFIGFDDWVWELKVLYSAVQDQIAEMIRTKKKTISEQHLGAEEKVAFEKMKAVYPAKIKCLEDVTRYTYEELCEDQSVSTFFSARPTIRANTAKQFTSEIAQYVSSGGAVKDEPQTWPLLRAVHLFVRIPLLACGAVIVDLPGSHDSNEARNIVADRFWNECTHFLVAAECKRAASNGPAFEKLRRITRAQMWKKVAFVCTISDVAEHDADDIKILGLEDAMSAMAVRVKSKTDERDNLAGSIRKLKKDQKADRKLRAALRKRRDDWQVVENRVKNGDCVFPVSLGQKNKRKRNSGCHSPSKRQRRDMSSEISDCQHETQSSDNESTRADSEVEIDSPLTVENKLRLTQVLRDLEKKIKNLEQTEDKIDNAIERHERRRSVLKREIAALQDAKDLTFIRARNEFSTEEVKRNFVNIVREFYNESFYDADGSTQSAFSRKEPPDYDRLYSDFPVFCTSAFAYLRLLGRRVGDRKHRYPFTDKEDTGIPAVRQHIVSISEKPVRNAALDFVIRLEKYLNSLEIWRTSEEGRVGEGSIDEKETASIAVHNSLETMHEELRKLTLGLDTAMKDVLEEQIFRHFPLGIHGAIKKSRTIMEDLWYSGPRQTGGLKWNSFRLICGRFGVQPEQKNSQTKRKLSRAKLDDEGRKGPIDMNEDLVRPITKLIALGWENAFNHDIPALIDSYLDNLVATVAKHCQRIQEDVRAFGLNQSQQALFRKKIGFVNGRFGTVANDRREDVRDRQKQLNRKFAVLVREVMTPAYTQAATEPHAPNMFVRMRGYISARIDEKREEMFVDCTNGVKKEMERLVDEVVAKFEEVVREGYDTLLQDLTTYKVLPVGNAGRVTRARGKGKKVQSNNTAKDRAGEVVEEFVEQMRRVVEGGDDTLAEVMNGDEADDADERMSGYVEEMEEADDASSEMSDLTEYDGSFDD
ncbi:hypothetical protein BJ508DRAFT_128620 [Ascobolus immersus RN42]|uniref:Dynamin N-terminal domain-containing protein n=1 Tax=Ascobolus immersus RN42 TaxID=1160509 RepID=A0A3N4I388_ASCIM|nr:hypothetical protein BJ508DRAFT_128620 [Ascobolus immersus RN42]